MNLKLEDVAAQRSFVFLWCGSCEGLDIGREVGRTSGVSVARRSDIAYWELLQYMYMNRHLLYLLNASISEVAEQGTLILHCMVLMFVEFAK